MKKCVFFFLIFFSIVSEAFAADESMPESETLKELLLFYDMEALYSVSFFPTTALQAPGYSYIITNDQIEKTPDRTLSDIISMIVPGMTTGGHERHGALIGTRGVFIDNNAKTMVMLDGQHINQRSHFGYTTGLLSPLLGDLKRVEVILGPSAIVHGSGAINGFVNLVPKNGEDNPGLYFASEYGFIDRAWKVESGYGATYGEGKNIYLYAGAYGAEGFEPNELYGSHKTFDIHANGYDSGNYRLSLYWNHASFNLNTFYYDNNPYKFSSVESGDFHQAALGIRPKYLFEISNTDSLELIGSLLWFDHSTPYFVRPNNRIEEVGGSERHWEIKNIYRTTRWKGHSLAGGFSYGEKEFFQTRQFFGEDVKLSLASVDTTWSELSVFAEDVVAVTDKLTAYFGLRYDKIFLQDFEWHLWSQHNKPDDIEGHFSPRIALTYELDRDMAVKASYQHGFRTPDASYYTWNLLYKSGAEMLGLNVPRLKNETMDSFELNFHKNLPSRRLKADVNLYYNIFKDQLSWKFYDQIKLFTPAQITAIRNALGLAAGGSTGSILNSSRDIYAYGGEIIVTYQPLKHTDISLSYGYVYLDGADEMLYPSHQVKLNAQSAFINNTLHFALNYLYNSAYSESKLPVAHSIYRKDRHVVDLAASYDITPELSVGVNVKNVFGNEVPPMVFTPAKPENGGLGFDATRVYVSMRFKL